MRFIAQQNSKECGKSVVNFILINYQKHTEIIKISTNFIPLSTISVLLSSNLVENKLKLVGNKSFFSWCNFPVILHCIILGHGHYIVALKKINDFLLVYDPAAVSFKFVSLYKLNKIWTGYMIECLNLKSNCTKNNFYIPYPLIVIFKYIILDIIFISVLIFLFYLKK